MIINDNIEVTVNDFDDQETVVKKIAGKLNTLPKYLYFPGGIIPTLEQFQNVANIDVIDILSILIDPSAGTYFTNVFNQIRPMLNPDIDIIKDILEPFIAYNQILERADETERFMMFTGILPQLERLNVQVDIETIWENRTQIKEELERKIKQSAESVSDITIYETDEVSYTDFILQREKFETKLNTDSNTTKEFI